MSEDSGTYILQTEGPEFRIARMHAVDNLFDEYVPATESWTPHVLTIVETYAKSKVYRDLSDAWDDASAIDDAGGETEYGPNLVTDFKDYKFSDFEDQYEKVKIKDSP